MNYVVIILASLFFAVSMPHVGAAADVNVDIGVSADQESSPPPDEQMEPLPPQYEEFEDEDFQGEAVAPPPLEFETEPDMVVVPSGESYVYLVPNRSGLYFYGGGWYRYHRGYWYRSSAYNGRWASVGVSLVPRVIVDVPPEYVTFLPPTYARIHYRDFHKGWRTWDHDRHWDRRDWFRHERSSEVRRERLDHIRAERNRIRREGHGDQRHDGDRVKHPKGGKGWDADDKRVKHPEGSKGRDADDKRVKHPEGGNGRDGEGDRVRRPEGGKGRDAGGDRVKRPEAGKGRDVDGDRSKQGGQDRSTQRDKDKSKSKDKDKSRNKDKDKDKDKDND